MLNEQEQNNVAVVREARRSRTETELVEVMYAINRLRENDGFKDSISDIMTDEQITALLNARDAIADALGIF